MDSEVAEILRLCRGLNENDWHQVKAVLDEMEKQKLKKVSPLSPQDVANR